MGIRKEDVRNYIAGKVRGRKMEIKQAVTLAVKTAIRPILLAKYAEGANLERKAEALYEAYLLLPPNVALYNDYSFIHAIKEVNRRVIGFRDEYITKTAGYVAGNLLDFNTDGFPVELEDVVSELTTSLADTLTEYRETKKVTDEVLNIVEGCRNGDAAYKKLKELGVDMTDFKYATPNLPAVVKLTGDVNLLNGSIIGGEKQNA